MRFWIDEVPRVYAYRNSGITRPSEALTIALLDRQYNCMKETVTYIHAQWTRKPCGT